MKKDTEVRPAEPVLWAYLGLAEAGLKKYDDAETAYKKALEVDAASKKPSPAIEGMANAGLGEIYARGGKVPEANAAYDAAAKANPTSAGTYLRNQAVIFFQTGNADAQVAAADKAIKNDPNDALVYYLKGQGLVQRPPSIPRRSALFCLKAAPMLTRSILNWRRPAPMPGRCRQFCSRQGRRSIPITRRARSKLSIGSS